MNCNFIGMSNLFHNNKDSSGELFQGWSFEKENYIFFIELMLVCGQKFIAIYTVEMITDR